MIPTVVQPPEAPKRKGFRVLSKKEMAGFYVNRCHPSEWRIYPEALATPLRNASVTDAQPLRDPGETVAEPPRSSIDSRLLDMVDDLQSKLDKANRELQAATYRVGYLENQVSERENDIIELNTAVKLLTDSQHKPSWWQRFKAFFVKS